MKWIFQSNRQRVKLDNTASDEKLLNHIVDGSEQALIILMDRYKGRVFSFIRLQISQPQDVEEICQDVFVELCKSAKNFKAQSKFSTFLFSIAKNLVFNYHRNRKRKLKLVDKPMVDMEPEVDDASCLYQQLVNELISSLHLKAICSLSSDNRQLLYLCDKEGFSYQDISQILGINVGTVGSKINTARKIVIEQVKHMEANGARLQKN